MATVLDAFPWIADRFHVVRTRGEWVDTKCPFGHDNALVSWSLGETGAACFKCWHGCDKLSILRAIGLSWRDCFPKNQDWERVRRECAATYVYRNESGGVAYYKERWEPGYGGNDKTFFLLKPDRSRGIDGCPRVLYRLPQLLAEPESPVWIVEGEKDCDNLARIGLLATCSISSSEEWGEHYARPLTGRDLVIVADDDATGWRHACEVAGAMIRHRAASIRLLALTGAKDCTEFLNKRRMQGVHSANDLQAALWEEVLNAAEWRVM